MYVDDALAETKTVDDASKVPVQVSVTVSNPADAHTISFTVSGVPETSESEDVELNVTICPGLAGELSVNTVKLGRWFTSNGEELVAFVP